METKEIKNALVEAMKNELKDFTQVQRDLKKSRKLQYRPKNKSLWDIQCEIDSNACKIQKILYYYTWLRHGKRYWANRDIDSLWSYFCSDYNTYYKYPIEYKDKEIFWKKIYDEKTKLYVDVPYKTYEESEIYHLKEYISKKCDQYGIEIPNDFEIFINK